MHGLFFRRIRSTESKQWAKVFPASIFDFRGKSNSRRSSFSISSKHVVVLGKAFVLTSKAILQSRFEHLKEREATPRSKGRNWVSIYLVHRICISSMDIHGVYAWHIYIYIQDTNKQFELHGIYYINRPGSQSSEIQLASWDWVLRINSWSLSRSMHRHHVFNLHYIYTQPECPELKALSIFADSNMAITHHWTQMNI